MLGRGSNEGQIRKPETVLKLEWITDNIIAKHTQGKKAGKIYRPEGT